MVVQHIEGEAGLNGDRRFYRAGPARGRAGGNAGLGLSIAKGLVEQMGGQIGAESVLGQGTTIWLVFPAA